MSEVGWIGLVHSGQAGQLVFNWRYNGNIMEYSWGYVGIQWDVPSGNMGPVKILCKKQVDSKIKYKKCFPARTVFDYRMVHQTIDTI